MIILSLVLGYPIPCFVYKIYNTMFVYYTYSLFSFLYIYYIEHQVLDFSAFRQIFRWSTENSECTPGQVNKLDLYHNSFSALQLNQGTFGVCGWR